MNNLFIKACNAVLCESANMAELLQQFNQISKDANLKIKNLISNSKRRFDRGNWMYHPEGIKILSQRLNAQVAFLRKNIPPIDLTIGKYELLNNRPAFGFDYSFVKTSGLLSKPTQSNLDYLEEYGFSFEKVYITQLDRSPRKSYYITGYDICSRKPFVYVRKETEGASSGQTFIYYPDSYLQASRVIEHAPKAYKIHQIKNKDNPGVNADF